MQIWTLCIQLPLPKGASIYIRRWYNPSETQPRWKRIVRNGRASLDSDNSCVPSYKETLSTTSNSSTSKGKVANSRPFVRAFRYPSPSTNSWTSSKFRGLSSVYNRYPSPLSYQQQPSRICFPAIGPWPWLGQFRAVCTTPRIAITSQLDQPKDRIQGK